MKHILLLGGDTRALYGLIRFFNGAGVAVSVADCGIRSIAATTKLARYLYLPTIVTPIEHYLAERLAHLCSEAEFDAILPVTDQAYWRLHNSPIESDLRSLVIGYNSETYRALNDKAHVQQIAAAHFRAPALVKTIDPDRRYVVKDRASFQSDQLETRGRVALRYGRDLVDAAEDSLVYEYLVGGFGAGIGLVAEAGRILALSAHRRLHEAGFAGSAIRERIEIPLEIRARVESFAAATGLNGLNMIEFKIIDGEWYFIELNPRPWGSLPLYLAQPDFVRSLACAHGIEATVPTVRSRIQVNLVKTVRNQPKALLRLLPQLSRIAFDEIGPQENLLLRFAAQKLRAQVSFRRHQLTSMLRQADWRRVDGTPIFVCFGNINRSALAEATWQHAGHPATSCGTIERAGRDRSAPLQAYLANSGIGVEGPSRPFDLQANGPLVIFDRYIYEDLVFRLGVDRRRIFLFSSNQIPDPHGRAPTAFARVFARIQARLKKV